MSYSDSEGHIDSDEYHCDDCDIRFRTYERWSRHMEQTCPDCEAHTRKRYDEEDFYDSHDCKGRWGWHALIQYGDGSPPVQQFLGGPRNAEDTIKAQFGMWITALKGRGYANVEWKRWWGQEFEEESEMERVVGCMDWTSSLDSLESIA